MTTPGEAGNVWTYHYEPEGWSDWIEAEGEKFVLEMPDDVLVILNAQAERIRELEAALVDIWEHQQRSHKHAYVYRRAGAVLGRLPDDGNQQGAGLAQDDSGDTPP
jgi:hypothetical protein